MKHYLRFLITMLLLVLFGGGSFGQTWQKVELKDLTSDDVFVIVDVLNGYAISNAAISKRPAAVSVTLNEAGDRLTGVVKDNLKWKVTSDGGDYIFTSNASSNNILYWTGNSTDLKVGTLTSTSDAKKNEYHKFNESTSDIYTGLKTKKATRYICNFNNQNWRCYDGASNNGSNLTANKTKLAYFKYVKDTKTATNVTFGAGVDGKSIDVTEGKEASFSGNTATEKDNVAGSIKYTSDKPEIVAVDETTGVVTFNNTKTFGTATITALFTPTDAAKYKESSASYTINYKEKERIATTLAFAETKGSVKLGDTFTLPELTLTAGDETLTGRTYTYSSSAPKVASIDENTGEVKILSAGTTVLTAEFVDPEDKYNKSSAEYTLKVIDPNTIVFSAVDKSFENVGTYSNTESEIDCNFVSTSGEYTFRVLNCMTNTNNATPLYGCLQMSSSDSERGNGIVKSPSFDAFPNGYKVTVYYTKSSSSEYMTISSDKFSDVKSTSTQTGDECITTISLPSPFAKFTMTANKGAKYVSKIELTALAAPEIETVTLDETSDNISTVISENNGKTVNVTLKRTISKDYLNPVCLPFDLSAEKIAEVFGVGSVVSDYTSVEGTVMNFTPVTKMTANHPYIVQATESFDTKNIAGVTLKTYENKENSVEFENTNHTFLGSFVGSPSIVVFSKENIATNLFLGKDGNLYHPTADSKMKGMRAYFDVYDYTGSEAKVNIGGSLSSIGKLMNGEAITGKVYNLNGQYVGNTLDGLAKGLYIINGKKYIVK
mgnify:CR=1 FL=1